MSDFTYPETVECKAAFMASKSRKTQDGFEGCAAVYFMGRRVSIAHAHGPTRARAKSAAEKASGVRQIEQALTLGSNY